VISLPTLRTYNLNVAGWQEVGRTKSATANEERVRVASWVVPMIERAEGDEEILSIDVSDCVLERAASAEQNAFTVVYCTTPWYNCGLPQ